MQNRKNKASLILKSHPIARAREYSHSAYNRFVTFNGKRYSRLQTLSRKSNDEIYEIIHSMNNICNTMLRCANDSKAERQIHSSAINASSRLRSSIKLNQNIIKEFNIEDHNDKFLSYERLIEFKRPKSSSHSTNNIKQTKNVSTITTIPFHDDNTYHVTLNEHDSKLNTICDKRLKEMNKLQALKGEILMMEQNKKYGVNKKYEHRKEYENSHFLRESSFQPINKHKYIKSKYNQSTKTQSTSLNDNNNNNNTTMMGNYFKVSPSYSSFLSSRPISKTTNTNTATMYNNNSNSNYNITNGSNIKTSVSSTNNDNKTLPRNNLQLKPTSSSKSDLFTTIPHPSKPKKHKQLLYLTNVHNNFLKNNSYSHFNTCNSNNESNIIFSNNNHNKQQPPLIPQTFINKLQTLHVNAFEENIKLMKSINNSKERSKRCKSNQNENNKVSFNNEVDIDKINKEFGFDSKQRTTYEEIDEVDIIKKNGDKLKRLLDKQGKMVLKNIVNRIIYNYKQINKKYYLDSSYERKLLYIKMQKEFQKVCNETIAIEKAMGDEIVPRDEKEVIKTMISKLINIENNSYQSILDLKRKAKVMKNIKPLIHEKKFKIKKK